MQACGKTCNLFNPNYRLLMIHQHFGLSNMQHFKSSLKTIDWVRKSQSKLVPICQKHKIMQYWKRLNERLLRQMGRAERKLYLFILHFVFYLSIDFSVGSFLLFGLTRFLGQLYFIWNRNVSLFSLFFSRLNMGCLLENACLSLIA